ncbi:hypothetical protein CASFOL_006356 [Castilleja foliolosa]|uniref:RBR-type E3 ubiquitin transferase n=1 Tax=Castilleja foliolosa TaxID=1961234 RepID=A0ABD3E6J3_9LAMI
MDFYCSDDDDYDELDEIDVSDEAGEEELLSDDAGEEELLDSFAPVNPRHKSYRSLKQEDIKKLQQKDISDVCNVLSVSRSVACTLLCQNRWMPSSVYDTWFDRPIVEFKKTQTEICNICYETTDKTPSTQCGHLFCVDCWKSYISVSIENGPGCLTLRCPEPGCKSNPGFEMVDLVSSQNDKNKYYQFLYRSYIESSPNRKWCPAPGCEFAIAFDGVEGDSFDVTCDCGFKFCYKCGFNEIHSPLDCDTLVKWTDKNNCESENTNWILAYTKPCPKCKRPIEKNQGCSVMTCRPPCNNVFCWQCLGPLNHPYGRCNRYVEEKSDKKLARENLNRYMHYYERWLANDKSMKMALKDMDRARDEIVDRLIDKQKQSRFQAMIVVDAWEQIVECRRVLKWSYVYGYYRVSGCEKWKSDFFEHLQGEAETALERLHHCAEKEMVKYLSADCVCEGFDELRGKLVGLTSVTKNYFENFVRALENNLEEDGVGDKKVKQKTKKRGGDVGDRKVKKKMKSR